MFCTNCGAQIPDGVKFCTSCGTPAQQPQQQQPLQAQQQQPQQLQDVFAQSPQMPSVSATAVMPTTSAYQAPQPERPTSHKGRTALIVVAVIVLLAIIAAVVLVVVNPFGVGGDNTFVSEQTSSDTPSSEQTASKSNSDTQASNGSSEDLAAAERPSSTSANETTTDSTPGSASASSSTNTAPFYGVWIGAFAEKNNADNFCAEARSKGFNPRIFESNQWTNLNQNHYWVVAAEVAQTQDEADRQLTAVKSAGYSDAYVKYSGTYKG